MKKLAFIILAVLMTVGNSASASTTFDCGHSQKAAFRGLEVYNNLTDMLIKSSNQDEKDDLRKLRQEVVESTNMHTNAYIAFCK